MSFHKQCEADWPICSQEYHVIHLSCYNHNLKFLDGSYNGRCTWYTNARRTRRRPNGSVLVPLNVYTIYPKEFFSNYTGTGIALVSALRAKVPVLLHDRSQEQITKGLGLIDKLLTKDVSKGKLTDVEAKEARERIRVVDSMEGLRDADMVVEVRL